MSPLEHLIGKTVEITFPTENDRLSYSDSEKGSKDVIIGKLLSVDDMWSVIRVYSENRKSYNDVAVNNYCIMSILEVKKDLCTADIYISDTKAKHNRKKRK